MLALALYAFANFETGDYLHIGCGSIPVARLQATRVDLVRRVTHDGTRPTPTGRMHP